MRTWTLRFRVKDMDNFGEIREGLKRIETRAATLKYQKIQKDDSLMFVCGTKRLTKRVTKVSHFKSITAMLKTLPMRSIMPSVHSIKDMRKAYYSYPGYKEKIHAHGIVAWHIK